MYIFGGMSMDTRGPTILNSTYLEDMWVFDISTNWRGGWEELIASDTTEAAQWLIDTGKLGERGALGTDTFGPDLGNDETYPVSVKLYDRRRISLENLTNLESIPTTGAYVLVGGTINRDGSGSPATIFGLVPRIP